MRQAWETFSCPVLSSLCPPSLSHPSLNVNAVRTEPRLTLLRNTAGNVIQVLPTVNVSDVKLAPRSVASYTVVCLCRISYRKRANKCLRRSSFLPAVQRVPIAGCTLFFDPSLSCWVLTGRTESPLCGERLHASAASGGGSSREKCKHLFLRPSLTPTPSHLRCVCVCVASTLHPGEELKRTWEISVVPMGQNLKSPSRHRVFLLDTRCFLLQCNA